MVTAGEPLALQVLHLQRVLNDLLDATRLSQGKIETRMENVEVVTIENEAIDVVKPLMNAAQFTEPEGSIHLQIEQEGNDPVLRVRDTGPGMGHDDRRRSSKCSTSRIEPWCAPPAAGAWCGRPGYRRMVTSRFMAMAGTRAVSSP